MLVAITTPAPAALIEFETPENSTISNLPVSAFVTFITGLDTITVVLQNQQADPKGVAQNLSSLKFLVSTGQTSGALTSSIAAPRSVAGDGSYTDGTPADTGWQLRTTDGWLDLHVLDTPVGPAHTIIGPPHDSDIYKSAKGSIAANPPHNPFLGETAQFELSVPGVTEASTIEHVIFGFNTTPGDDIYVPEPTALCVLGASGVIGLVARRKRRV